MSSKAGTPADSASTGKRGAFATDFAAFVEIYSSAPFSFGGADIFCMGATGRGMRIAELLAILLQLKDDRGRHVFERMLVILPPTEVTRVREEDLWTHFQATVLRESGASLNDEALARVRRIVEIRHSSNLNTSAALDLLRSILPSAAAIVCDCFLYRDEGVPAPNGTSEGETRVEEDRWVPHLRTFASRGTELMRDRKAYAVFDAGVRLPAKSRNLEALLSIGDCGVKGVSLAVDIVEVVAERSEEWLAQVRSGRSDSVLAEIDALPSSLDEWKESLKIQMLHHAGRHEDVLTRIRGQLASDDPLDGNVRLQLAHMANAAGDAALAEELLRSAIPLPASQESLEVAVATAGSISKAGLELEILQRLERTFPHSQIARTRRIELLLSDSRKIGLGEALGTIESDTSNDLQALSVFLRARLTADPEIDHADVVIEVERRWPTLTPIARLSCGVCAHAKGAWAAVLEHTKPSELKFSAPLQRYAARILLDALERALLGRDAKLAVEPPLESVRELIAYLSRAPDDTAVRVELSSLLSVQSAGSIGVPILAIVTLELATKGLSVEFAQRQVRPSLQVPECFGEFLRGAFVWAKANGPVTLGKTQLPRELLIAPPDELLQTLDALAQSATESEEDTVDLRYLENLCLVGCLVAPHSSRPNEDLTFLRLAADRFAIAGRSQRARDWAEQALTMANGDALRSRMAWFTFADVYQRLNNLTEALVGMACTLASESPVDLEQGFYEGVALVRILRDLGLADRARDLLPLLRGMLERLALERDHSHRLDTLELSLRLVSAHASEASPADLSLLVEDMEKNCRQALSANDELTPAAVLLAQGIAAAERAGLPANDAASKTLAEALSRLSSDTVALIQVMSDSAPRAIDVLKLVHRMETARYADDVGFDVKSPVLAAKRLLASEDARKDSAVAAFAIELLADHAIALPTNESAAPRSPWLVPSIETSSQIACELSAEGLQVSLLAIDSEQRLTHVTATDGSLGNAIRENETTFSWERLQSWSETYPYEYGTQQQDVGNLFYTSMEGMRISLSVARRILLVMDTRLQRLPPNLLLVEEEPIGRRAAMGSAPSLAWLNAVRGTPPSGRLERHAWIPTTGSGTLGVVAERLRDTFDSHRFIVSHDAALPASLANVDVAIVSAHGGVSPEDRQYFQVVADEEALKLSPMDLARALAGTRVVMLFICSGGRFDSHPMASTTVGLPKELLDRGCRTVIASPWPLDARVPSHWLPTFLRTWERGEPAIDANFEANMAVERAMGNSPDLCLAMNLYGDPFSVAHAE